MSSHAIRSFRRAVCAVVLLTPVAAWGAGPAAPPALIAPTTAAAAPKADNPIDQCLADTLAALEKGDAAAAVACSCYGADSVGRSFMPGAMRYEIAMMRLRRIFAEKFPDAPLPRSLATPISEDFLRVFLALPKRDRPVIITGETAVTRRYFDPIEVTTLPIPELRKYSGAGLYFRKVDGQWKMDYDRTFRVEFSIQFNDAQRAPATMDDVHRAVRAFADGMEAAAAELKSATLASPKDFDQRFNEQLRKALDPLGQRGMTLRQELLDPGTGEDTAPDN